MASPAHRGAAGPDGRPGCGLPAVRCLPSPPPRLRTAARVTSSPPSPVPRLPPGPRASPLAAHLGLRRGSPGAGRNPKEGAGGAPPSPPRPARRELPGPPPAPGPAGPRPPSSALPPRLRAGADAASAPRRPPGDHPPAGDGSPAPSARPRGSCGRGQEFGRNFSRRRPRRSCREEPEPEPGPRGTRRPRTRETAFTDGASPAVCAGNRFPTPPRIVLSGKADPAVLRERPG